MALLHIDSTRADRSEGFPELRLAEGGEYPLVDNLQLHLMRRSSQIRAIDRPLPQAGPMVDQSPGVRRAARGRLIP